MLKNKIILKKIRNIFILLMAIIIMMGAYYNIRKSRAENVIEIEMQVADKSGTLENQTIKVEATETQDGIYLMNLPSAVNGNIVTKYYIDEETEIEIDYKNNLSVLELTEEEVTTKKVQVQTDYDKKEIISNEETQEKEILYNKELTNETTDVILTGYMPLDAQLEIKDIDINTLSNVKIPNEKETMKKAFEVSLYKMVEVPNTDTNTEETENIENTESTNTIKENTVVENTLN